MALTKDQWERVTALTAELRAMNCMVCIFTPDDVESAVADRDENDGNDDAPEMTGEQSTEWIFEHRKYLEDTMSSAGNSYMTDNLPVRSASA